MSVLESNRVSFSTRRKKRLVCVDLFEAPGQVGKSYGPTWIFTVIGGYATGLFMLTVPFHVREVAMFIRKEGQN